MALASINGSRASAPKLQNMPAMLSAQDRDAIALYIAALPPRQGPEPPPKKKD